MTDQRFGLATIMDASGLSLAVHRGERVLRLAALLGDQSVPRSVRALLPDWDAWVQRIEQALGSADEEEWEAEAAVRFSAPVPDAQTVYCAGANFYDHVKEMGFDPPSKQDDPIFHFAAPPASLVGHREPVLHPLDGVQLDWEVELVALIGRPARRVPAAEALSYVAGYTVANDISLRDQTSIFHPIFGVRWVLAKGQETMNPMGPAVVPAKYVDDPMALAMELLVNNEPRQKSNTNQMIWTLQEQIEVLSRFVTLCPGDLIMTGTPAGTATAHGTYLKVGDRMRASVEGIGTLKSHIVDPP